MNAKRIATWTTLVLMALFGWGCGSNRGAGDSVVGGADTVTNAATLGIGNCVNCHSSIAAIWIESRHGNSNTSPSSPHLPGESSCAVCHNPLDDGAQIADAFGGTEVRRDVIGCESCHGGGGLHSGVGPIPYPAPGPERCAACHNRDDRHHGSENSVSDKYQASKHAASDHTGRVCQRCHTHEGALLANVYGYTGDKTVLGTNTAPGKKAPAELADEETGSVQCATCHDVHNAGKLRRVFGWNPNNNLDGDGNPIENDAFDLCTSCHTYVNPNGTIVASGSAASGTAPFYHDTAWYRIIASTHYDNPATGPVSGDDPDATILEGYVLRLNQDNPCFDCHGHESMTNTRPRNPADPSTPWTQWASSAHGGGLFKVKLAAAAALDPNGTNDPSAAPRSTDTVDAIMAVGATDATGAAWTHYNWDRSGRAGCQRCHTATGAMNFMNDPVNYNSASNDFSHLAGWTADPAAGSPQNEMLYCWACHTSAADGILRNPGAITEQYDPLVAVSYPDVSGSNVCMACHLGRETGEVIKVDADADGVRSFINSHYLSAGGQLFATTGYEYAGENYNNVTFFAHDKIGTVDAAGTGSNGPCVGCHMSSAEKHLFLPVAKDESTGLITAVTATVCINCHDGSQGPAFVAEGGDAAAVQAAADFLNTEEEDYAAALEALKAALAGQGMYFANAHPYFFTAPYVGDGSDVAFTNWAGVYGLASWKDTMGAAFNANLLIHDPGGFAHNRYYIKALIWDSIDFIDNGSLDDSVVATIQALETAGDLSAADSAAAQAYLGTSRPGDAFRP